MIARDSFPLIGVDPIPEMPHSGVDTGYPGKPAVDSPGDDADDVPMSGNALANKRGTAVALARILSLLTPSTYLRAGRIS